MGEFTDLAEGWYTVGAKITDKRGAYSGVTMSFQVKPEHAEIISCAKLQGTFDEQVAAAKLLETKQYNVSALDSLVVDVINVQPSD